MTITVHLDHFFLHARSYDHPDSSLLVRALFDDQVERYGYADPFEADAAYYAPPDGLFLVGYHDEVPVTCGGYRPFSGRLGIVEIKKMYTVPHLRGLGLGERIITALERQAMLDGVQRSILETGVRNTAALALYARMGYQPTERYMDNRDPAINRAFIKDLTRCPATP
ncbi:GNAT family N-acetyltransferase [Nonomuraea glycinis]|uniref:N-acetyltransferase n=1 Tax=Nonomuraea glycinis TaxID=2047744 RepID=A0A918A8M6_9ACTN|nr:GNAT family N-acetyltransferase [Nonomuraea glycinis]MCA2178998.1 GNAT family N-acetyltransferase [Nonomuraea glycinis]GGP08471.1 N-acetyltransferase [Nonomuraea glycinis]